MYVPICPTFLENINTYIEIQTYFSTEKTLWFPNLIETRCLRKSAVAATFVDWWANQFSCSERWGEILYA